MAPKAKPDKTEQSDVEVVMDNKDVPMVLWFPETQELEVRVHDMLDASGLEPANPEAFERLKTTIHDRLREAFQTEEITTLVQGRIMALDTILKAAKKGDLVELEKPASMAELLAKRTLN